MANKVLSPENKARIHFNGVYGAEPEDFRDDPMSNSRYWATSGAYHCRTWNFKPSEGRDGVVRMYDTYWSSGGDNYFVVSDDNIDKFHCLIEDVDKWKRVRESEVGDFDPSDVVVLASDSSGYRKYFLRKDASPVVARQISRAKDKLSNEIRSAIDTYSLGFAIRELEKTMDGVDMSEFDDSAEYQSMYAELSAMEEVAFDERENTAKLLGEDREVAAFRSLGYYWIAEGLSGRYIKTVPSDTCGEVDIFAIPEKDIFLMCNVDGTRANAVVMTPDNFGAIKECTSLADLKVEDTVSYEHRCADAADVLAKAAELVKDLEVLKAKYSR